MSNPVTNSQVEDVLSSIRRLVSDNKRAGTPDRDADEADRLVLSPQQRVASQTGETSDAPAAPASRAVLTLMPEDAVRQDGPVDDGVSETMPARSGDHSATNGDAARGGSLADKVAALETAIAARSDQWEPDGDGRDAYSGTRAPAISLQNTVDLDGTGAPIGEDGEPLEPVATVRAEAGAGVQPDADADPVPRPEEHILDEAALTELVANIVRRELQGDLGERITRNVRKLVRREVMRALATRDLDQS
ncbi:hypothetical protein [uncultured Roseobacter sp.]|uniref:hypothetical protein n=1 Tax=uncultured Roseobacter sp. TaxID=114847 RepID=UPI00261C0A27|nr:hypothetical protein [uncultured Roseobacter sp.]